MATDPLQARLAALAEPALPASLWTRVAHARQQQRTARRRLATVGTTLIVCAVALPFVLRQSPAPAPAPVAASTTVPMPAVPTGDPLRAVDRELQRAYDRGASEQELQWLWQRRDAVARTAGTPTAPHPVEI